MMTAMTLEPGSEQQRLAQHYASMTEEELQAVAAAAVSLTDSARQALQNEIGRRGLAIVLNDREPGQEVLEQRNLVMLRHFRDLPEALMAKGSLDSAGVESFLADDNMIRMDWFISNLLGGIKLLVDAEDAEDARTVLSQPIPESLEIEGVGEYAQPRCPSCQSLDVSFEELNKKVAYPSAYLGLPIPLHRKAWRCDACGHEWEDEAPETAERKE